MAKLSVDSVSRRQVAVALLAVLASKRSVADAAYPSRFVKLIVSHGAGSSPDLIARQLAAALERRWQHPVVIDNRPGAGGTIGTQLLTRSPSDGYTLGYTTPSLVIQRALGMRLPYDIENDLRMVVQTGVQPAVLLVLPSSPFRSVEELIEHAKRRPGELAYASTGSGGVFHLCAELFRLSAGISLLHVPYSAGPAAMTDMIGGRVDLMFNALNVALPQVRAGRLTALAVTGPRRSVVLPDVPTVAESGLPGYEVLTWGGLAVPAGVPDNIVTALNQHVNAALATPEMRGPLTESGYELVGGTPAQFSAFVRSELLKWTDVVRRAGVKAE